MDALPPDGPWTERTTVATLHPGADRDSVRRALHTLSRVRSPTLAPLVRVSSPASDVVALTHRVPADAVTVGHLRERGPLRVGHVLAVATAALEALVALHEAGLAHGGVDVDHLLVGMDGAVVLGGTGAAWRFPPGDEAGPRRLDDVEAVGVLLRDLLGPGSAPAPLVVAAVRACDPDATLRPDSSALLDSLRRCGSPASLVDALWRTGSAPTGDLGRRASTRATAQPEPGNATEPSPAPSPASTPSASPEPDLAIEPSEPESALEPEPEAESEPELESEPESDPDPDPVLATGPEPELEAALEPESDHAVESEPEQALESVPAIERATVPATVPVAVPARPTAPPRPTRARGRRRPRRPVRLTVVVVLGVLALGRVHAVLAGVGPADASPALRPVAVSTHPPATVAAVSAPMAAATPTANTAPTAVATPTTTTTATAAATASAAPTATSTAPATTTAPATRSATEWVRVLAGLDEGRRSALAAGDEAALARWVDPAGASFAGDLALLHRLRASGAVVVGGGLVVGDVRLQVATSDVAVIDVLDRRAAYVVRTAAGSTAVPGRGWRWWTLRLTSSGDRWRLSSAAAADSPLERACGASARCQRSTRSSIIDAIVG